MEGEHAQEEVDRTEGRPTTVVWDLRLNDLHERLCVVTRVDRLGKAGDDQRVAHCSNVRARHLRRVALDHGWRL
jgi:hypothetical protein